MRLRTQVIREMQNAINNVSWASPVPVAAPVVPPRCHPHFWVRSGASGGGGRRCSGAEGRPRGEIFSILLCRRVAQELGGEVGEEVGYCVGHDRRIGAQTRLLFVTTGWLTSKLLHQPGFLQDCSHVVLDEIHDRSVDADLLSVLIRLLVPEQRPHIPRLLLMSATFESDLFTAYFALS